MDTQRGRHVADKRQTDWQTLWDIDEDEARAVASRSDGEGKTVISQLT